MQCRAAESKRKPALEYSDIGASQSAAVRKVCIIVSLTALERNNQPWRTAHLEDPFVAEPKIAFGRMPSMGILQGAGHGRNSRFGPFSIPL